VAFQALASPQENTLITTDPAELATYAEQESRANDEVYVDLGIDGDPDGHVDLDAAA